jgi:hypothetical protein
MIFRLLPGLFVAAAAFGTTISIDTASLEGNPNAPFTLDFQFTDGSATGDGNNTVTLDNFNLSGGSLTLDSASVVGGVTVDNSPLGIEITDSSFFNDIQFTFVPGPTLTFNLTTTSNADAGTPDEFVLALLDSGLNDIPTTNPSDGIALVEYNFPTTDPDAAAKLTLSGTTTNSDGVTIPRPTKVASTPEPSGVFWLLLTIPILHRVRRSRLG